jgi:SAM-dependent methyltransferase
MFSMVASLRTQLEHPLTRGLSIDDPRTTALRRRILVEKSFLRRLYEAWYGAIAASVPSDAALGPVLEIGSGAGFLAETGLVEGLITSDVFLTPGADLVLDARHMPFADGSLRAIVMTDALHHIAAPRAFMAEATRCVRPGGVVSMVEPWVTPWSRLIYGRLHHEPFRPESIDWEFPETGPLSGANGALPWIMFDRDRAIFEREFPDWVVGQVKLMMPVRYLLSGGVSMRTLVPQWSYSIVNLVETMLHPYMNHLAMFAHITLHRRGARKSVGANAGAAWPLYESPR